MLRAVAINRYAIEQQVAPMKFLAMRNTWIRQALVLMLDTIVCNPVLLPTAAGQLLDLSDNTVRKYRRSASP